MEGLRSGLGWAGRPPAPGNAYFVFFSLSLSLSPRPIFLLPHLLRTPQPPRPAGLLAPLSALLSSPFLRPQLSARRPCPRFVSAPRRDTPGPRFGPVGLAALLAGSGAAARCPLAALLRGRWSEPPPSPAPAPAPAPPPPSLLPPERRRCPACHGAAPPQPRAAPEPPGAVSTARGAATDPSSSPHRGNRCPPTSPQPVPAWEFRALRELPTAESPGVPRQSPPLPFCHARRSPALLAPARQVLWPPCSAPSAQAGREQPRRQSFPLGLPVTGSSGPESGTRRASVHQSRIQGKTMSLCPGTAVTQANRSR